MDGKEFGEWVREWRAGNRENQAGLARAMSEALAPHGVRITQSDVSEVEGGNGGKPVSLAFIVGFALVAGISIDSVRRKAAGIVEPPRQSASDRFLAAWDKAPDKAREQILAIIKILSQQ